MSKYKVGDYVELKEVNSYTEKKFGWLTDNVEGSYDFGFVSNQEYKNLDVPQLEHKEDELEIINLLGYVNECNILRIADEPKEETIELKIDEELLASKIKFVDLDIALTDSERFKLIQDVNYKTYKEKNEKYGDSFSKSVQKYGMIAALTRMSDKWNRIENMILNGIEDNEESLIDSIDDLSNYLIMTHIELEKGNKK